MKKLDPAAMMAEAEKLAGLKDWGGDEFLEPFFLLTKSINEEGELTEDGMVRARERLMHRLCQRLKLFEDRKRRPEIVAQKIERPIFVNGLPRAGTTYTHALLAADPANVAPIAWQFFCPSPPPNDPAIDHTAQIREAQELVERQGWNNVHIKAMHDFDALHPEECARAFELSFHCFGWSGYWSIPSYMRALPGIPSSSAYEMHKKILQALQIGAEGRRWVLKTPDHILRLDGLFKVYPDAMLVLNHRDPSKVIASLVSILTGLLKLSTNNVLNVSGDLVRGIMQSFADAQNRLLEQRRDPEFNKHFIDVNYLDLERDPLAVMRQIYAHAGMTYTDASAKAMARWIDVNRKGRHGKHSYRLEDVKVSQAEIHEMFGNYLKHYNIELEYAV